MPNLTSVCVSPEHAPDTFRVSFALCVGVENGSVTGAEWEAAAAGTTAGSRWMEPNITVAPGSMGILVLNRHCDFMAIFGSQT